jgi:hypothetical protein
MAQNPFDVDKGEWSVSGFDRLHSFSLDYIYEVPAYRNQRGIAGKLLGGWQINGIYSLGSGRPYTPEQTRNSLAFPNSYLDALFASTFTGLDSLRPFVGNPNANPRLVAITNIDARLSGLISGTDALSPTGYYLLNDLNRGVLTPVTPGGVRFVFNGPGAAIAFGTPFGTAPRNCVRGKSLNQLNLGVFKTTRIGERFSRPVPRRSLQRPERPELRLRSCRRRFAPGSDDRIGRSCRRSLRRQSRRSAEQPANPVRPAIGLLTTPTDVIRYVP